MDVQALLRIETEVLLFIYGLAVFITRDDTQLLEQFPHEMGILCGRRHIMRTPRIRGNGIHAEACVASGLRFELGDFEVAKSFARETPSRTQARDSAADDCYANASRVRRPRHRSTAKKMSDFVRCSGKRTRNLPRTRSLAASG